MNIGTVARKSGVPAKTIRYYETVGLIPAADRQTNGYRVYGDDDVQTLRFIQRARSLGFPMKDVVDLIALWRNANRASSEVKAVATDHIREIDRKLAELQAMRGTLVDLLDRCHGDARPECPILDSLAESVTTV